MQALDQTKPVPPQRAGIPARPRPVTTSGHGTTNLFAALNLLDGTVLARVRVAHAAQGCPWLLQQLERAVPKRRDIHLFLASSPIQVWPIRPPASR